MTPSQREARCGTEAVGCGGAAILRCEGRPGAWKTSWRGVLLCGHIWTCPVCSAKLRAVRLERIDRALENAGGTWWMLTLTIRHERTMPLARLLKGLLKAFRRMRQGGELQRTWTARVSASIRATEITHGKHGWHPHIHVLLRSEGWTEAEQADLVKRWERAVGQVLGPECVPEQPYGVDFGAPFDASHADERTRARYLTKLGAEIAGLAKEARNGNVSMWGVAERAAAGDEASILLWRELVEGTRGRRMIELDDRAVRFARMPRQISDVEPAEVAEVRDVVLWSEDLRVLATLERTSNPGALASVLAMAAASLDPERDVAELVRNAARAWFLARRAVQAA